MASLPYRVLPSRAVTLIHAYSRPLTRPDWRTIQRLTTFDLYSHVFCHLRPQTSLMKRIYYNILDRFKCIYLIYYIKKKIDINKILYSLSIQDINDRYFKIQS